MKRTFFRLVAVVVSVALVVAAMMHHLISANFAVGLVEGSIVFAICQPIENINHGALAFYGVLVIQIFVTRSLWAAVGYFISPFLPLAIYAALLSMSPLKPKAQ